MSQRMVVMLVLDCEGHPAYEDNAAAVEALRELVGRHLGDCPVMAGWLGTERVDEVISAIGPVGEAGFDLLGRSLPDDARSVAVRTPYETRTNGVL